MLSSWRTVILQLDLLQKKNKVKNWNKKQDKPLPSVPDPNLYQFFISWIRIRISNTNQDSVGLKLANISLFYSDSDP